MEDAERKLILRARQGEARAFELLVRRCDRQILALVLDMVGDAEDAQDVFQEALLAAYRGLPRFRIESDFSTWLYRIAVNRTLKFRRRRQRRAAATAGRDPEEIAAPAGGPEQDVLDAELQSQLARALERLSGRERAAFVLCHRQGFRIDQAAEMMACSGGSVKSYLFRGREKVKRFLQPYLES